MKPGQLQRQDAPKVPLVIFVTIDTLRACGIDSETVEVRCLK